MPGGVSYGFHEGSRSEHIASAVFSAFGAAVPVPYSEDYGLDFLCALTQQEGAVLLPVAYYAVQVKSTPDPWVFDTARKVRWFVECPMSIFLCVVTKANSRVRIFHTSLRFYAWANPPLLHRLELVPGTGNVGLTTQWTDGTTFSLSAPILDFASARVNGDRKFRAKAAGILKFWTELDERNLQNVRMNLRNFEIPHGYRTNVLPSGGKLVQGRVKVDKADLDLAISHLKEPLDRVSDQLFRHGDLVGAVRGMLLLRQLYADDNHQPVALSNHADVLNQQLGMSPATYWNQGIDSLGNVIDVTMLKGLKDRALLAGVRRLSMKGMEVTDSVIAVLAEAGELNTLVLHETGITDLGLRHLKGLKKLRILGLHHTRVSDAGLRFLAGLGELIVLNIAETNVSGAGLAHVKKLKNLENLLLTNTRVGDDALKHISKLSRLEVLILSGTRVTDQGLVHLRGLARLRRLDLYGTKITDAGAAEFMNAMPGVAVYPEPRHGRQRDK